MSWFSDFTGSSRSPQANQKHGYDADGSYCRLDKSVDEDFGLPDDFVAAPEEQSLFRNLFSRSADLAASSRQGEQETDPSSTNPGRAGAAGRESFIESQRNQTYNSGLRTPSIEFQGVVFRRMSGDTFSGHLNPIFSQPGRYNEAGTSIFYTGETPEAIEREMRNYDGFSANDHLIESEVRASVVDFERSRGVLPQALTEGWGAAKTPETPRLPGPSASQQSWASWLTGEDPYTLPREFAKGALDQGAQGVRVPANESSRHVNLFTDNLTDLATDYRYRSHRVFDGESFGPRMSTPGAVADPPLETTNRILKNPDNIPSSESLHRRASGIRYGAAGGAAGTILHGIAQGELELEDVLIGTASGVGAVAAEEFLERNVPWFEDPARAALQQIRDSDPTRAQWRSPAMTDDLLSASRGTHLRAGAVVDGALSAGFSAWSNADRWERGEISAADATADLIVDTGVGVGSGMAGMAAGAAVGSVVPVVGTAAGAVIGFAVGTGVAWFTSEAIDDWSGAGDWAREGLGNMLDNFEEPLDGAWGVINSGQDAIADYAGDAWSGAKGAWNSIWD